jgi:hypothetical protein
MQEKGHQYKGPLDPPADARFQPSGTTQERKTAKDDVACKASTNLVGRWYAVESAYQTALISDHKAELAALAQAQEAIHKLINTLTGTR